MIVKHLKSYLYRYNFYKEMLRKHPDEEELIKRKIEETKNLIIETVTSKKFEHIISKK